MPNSRTQFWNGPSGGLSYHGSALRYRHHRWAPFIAAVEQWLMLDWNPPQKELIIFGSSAGWTLSRRFLTRFSRVTLVEPDPVARALARLRFRSLTVIESCADATLLPPYTGRDETRAHLEQFLGRRPQAAVLFSNILGQLSLLASDRFTPTTAAHFQNELRFAIADRNWASYHDVLSSAAPWAHDAPSGLVAPTFPTLEELALRFFPVGSEAIDHLTRWVGAPEAYAAWDLRPSQRHIIGLVQSPQANAKSRR